MKEQLVTLLEKGGFISYERQAQILDLLQKKESLDEILNKFQVPSDKVADLKSSLYNLPKWVSNLPKREVLSKLSIDSCQHYRMCFLGETGGEILIGVLDPDMPGLRDAVSFLSNATDKKAPQLYILSYIQFQTCMEVLSGKNSLKFQDLGVSDRIVKNPTSSSDESPVVVLVRDLVGEAIKKGASDIHIEPEIEIVRVRYRIDGELVVVRDLPIANHLAIIARIKILCNLKLDERRRPQDGHFSIDYEGRKIDFRVSTMPSFTGEKVVIRVLDTYSGVRDLNALNLLPDHLKQVREALELPYGIVLISGPTGSGKTSTLYSMLNVLDHEKRNIVSLEDPVEYSLPGINQSQVAPDIGYTFATGLRSILRQDPDVIMVGEIRDRETAELAIQASLTGHLVFSTIHTNNAISTITRLIEMGIEPYLIAPTVRLVIAQRLVKKLLPEDKAQHEYIAIDGPYQQMVRQQFGDIPEGVLSGLPFAPYFHNPKPSADHLTGTEGRIGVFEMLSIDKEIENLILDKSSEQKIYEVARSKGMLTLKEDALLKSMQGLVPFSESMSL
jgi:type II secretory ATPase GspE/PulE/Tfp pilus assembly ATPase PilB-like protein